MNYRELLDYTKSNPGCLASREQKDIDAQIRFNAWVTRQNQDYERPVSTQKAPVQSLPNIPETPVAPVVENHWKSKVWNKKGR